MTKRLHNLSIRFLINQRNKLVQRSYYLSKDELHGNNRRLIKEFIEYVKKRVDE